jgi:membrane protein YdbS with pleckstrin-like domain
VSAEADIKTRFMRMAVINGLCLVAAVAAVIGALASGQDWLFAVFGVALAAGFVAQIWFIAAFRRAKEGV